MKEKIKEALSEVGCIVDDYSDNDKLSDYISDSLSFISFIVNVEEKCNCEIKPENLTKALYDKSMKEFENIIIDSIKK